MSTGAINVRGARQRMLEVGDIDRPTYIQMELNDGRLADGTPISILYFSRDPAYQRLLGGFMENPLSINENIMGEDEILGGEMVDDEKLSAVLNSIQDQRAVILVEWEATRSRRKADKVKQAYHALDWLEQQYQFAAGRILPPVPMQQRRQRTDIRVTPVEQSTEPGEQSAAQATAVQDENVPQVGGA